MASFVTEPTGTSAPPAWFLALSTQQVVFGLKACKEALIVMSEHKVTDSFSFHLKIGINNNTETQFSDALNKAINVTVPTPGILSCDEMRLFWVRWGADQLAFGSGTVVDKDTLLSHDYDEPLTQLISALGINMIDQNRGEWQFYNKEGKRRTLLYLFIY